MNMLKMTTKLLISLTLILTSQQFAWAYTLNGKHWAEPTCTILLPSTLDRKVIKRFKYIAWQYRKNVPFKVRVQMLDGAWTSALEASYYASANSAIIVRYAPDEDYDQGTRVAHTDFVTSQAGTRVHGTVITVNDIRLREVAGDISQGIGLNYFASVLAHETGHSFGLGHSIPGTKPTPIMTSGGKFSRLKNLGLTPDDRRGLHKIY